MTPSILPPSARTSDLGHLGIPPDLLPPELLAQAALEDDEPGDDDPGLAAGTRGGLRFTLAEDGDDLPDPLTLAREVRAGLEEALTLLIAALPATHRGAGQHPAQRAD